MSESALTQDLRVLLANERKERLEAASTVIVGLGHEVVATTVTISEVAALTREVTPDVAVVALGHDAEHALDQVEQIAEESECPVIVLLDRSDAEFVAEAARRGVFGSALDGEPAELQSSIEVALRRFAELRDLERAFRRRAVVERAKGVLMERHGIGEREAFEELRGQARRTQARMVTVAEAVLLTHTMLPGTRLTLNRDVDGPAPAGD